MAAMLLPSFTFAWRLLQQKNFALFMADMDPQIDSSWQEQSSQQHGLIMKSILIGISLLVLSGSANAAPVVYTNEALYLADLAALQGSTIHESFEDDTVWANSRNTIPNPGSTPTVTNQGIVWTSNYSQNNIATGTVGGSAPDGTFAIYSLPHGLTTDSGLYCDSAEDPNIPIECFQNDGLKVESETGGALYAFGGRIDTANNGKVTFLLDGTDINGNDTDNIDNWQREGDFVDNWGFVGVIDPDGFFIAELRELRGKDFQQVLLFGDDFTIQSSAVPTLPSDFNGDGNVDGIDLTDPIVGWESRFGVDLDGQDFLVWQQQFGNSGAPSASAISTPEPTTACLLLMGIVAALTTLGMPCLRLLP